MFVKKMRDYVPDAFGMLGGLVLVAISILICVGWFPVA